jgi:hypothetical protein
VSQKLVPIFYTGQDATWQQPVKIVPREEARAMKEKQLGVFVSSGRAFVLFKRDPAMVLRDQPQPDAKDAARKGDGRGSESVCVQEQTMTDYVEEYQRAREIIKHYHPRLFIQPLLVHV